MVWWFPPGTPVSSTSETDILSSSSHRYNMTLAVAEVVRTKTTKTVPAAEGSLDHVSSVSV